LYLFLSIVLLTLPPPPTSTLFPYTTLFRSLLAINKEQAPFQLALSLVLFLFHYVFGSRIVLNSHSHYHVSVGYLPLLFHHYCFLHLFRVDLFFLDVCNLACRDFLPLIPAETCLLEPVRSNYQPSPSLHTQAQLIS